MTKKVELKNDYGFSVRMEADSVNPSGRRLRTFVVTYPRFIHSELLTHRMFSRNSASSRAIPIETMLKNIEENPVIPLHWGANQAGMQAFDELCEDAKDYCENVWINTKNFCIDSVERLNKLGLHKQIANRIVEPWMFITVVLSTTSVKHFENLRCNKMAEPHFQELATLISEVNRLSIPKQLIKNEWHLPFLQKDDPEGDLELLKKLSVARCARVSYLTHDGKRDIGKDLELFDKLETNNHWSPFEHVAQAKKKDKYFGNFLGFKQLRKFYTNEFEEDAKYIVKGNS